MLSLCDDVFRVAWALISSGIAHCVAANRVEDKENQVQKCHVFHYDVLIECLMTIFISFLSSFFFLFSIEEMEWNGKWFVNDTDECYCCTFFLLMYDDFN